MPNTNETAIKYNFKIKEKIMEIDCNVKEEIRENKDTMIEKAIKSQKIAELLHSGKFMEK